MWRQATVDPNDILIPSSLLQKEKLIPIGDLFNDELTYKVSNVQSIGALNASMLVVAEKYRMFGDSSGAREEQKKFKNNFETLHSYLKAIDQDQTAEHVKAEQDKEDQFQHFLKEARQLLELPPLQLKK